MLHGYTFIKRSTIVSFLNRLFNTNKESLKSSHSMRNFESKIETIFDGAALCASVLFKPMTDGHQILDPVTIPKWKVVVTTSIIYWSLMLLEDTTDMSAYGDTVAIDKYIKDRFTKQNLIVDFAFKDFINFINLDCRHLKERGFDEEWVLNDALGDWVLFNLVGQGRSYDQYKFSRHMGSMISDYSLPMIKKEFKLK